MKRSPFPGMDPYIETSHLWGDFHQKLIGDIERYLAERLPERYFVHTGERSYLDIYDPTEEQITEHAFLPDLAVKDPVAPEAGASVAAAATLADPIAVFMHGVIEMEHREFFLEIRELDRGRRLVTSLEILSPTNKRPGTVGWDQYSRKRSAFLDGHASLVEIDLLRGGRRMAMAEPWPVGPYYCLVMRKDEAPKCQVWPAHFMHPLPVVPVPLNAPDPDIPLALQPLIDGVYARSRYLQQIDYTQPLRRPALRPEEAAWFRERLHAHQAESQTPPAS